MSGRIGVRVNPSVGGGTVDMLSTAERNSKFGLLMVDECEKKILDLYNEFSFLQGKKNTKNLKSKIVTTYVAW